MKSLPKKVLLAFDGTTPSRAAAAYLGTLFKGRDDFEVTVFCVARRPPAHLLSAVTLRERLEKDELFEKFVKESLEEAKKCAERGKEIVCECLDPSKVEVKVSLQQGDLAYEIIREAHSGRYDAVVVGRRGLSRLTQGFMGSVSFKVVEHANLPVWMVSGKDWSERVLVALDLGEAGFKVADHVAFVFSGAENPKITLLHVVYPFGISQRTELLSEIELKLMEEEERSTREFFEGVKEVFEEAGISPEAIEIKIVKSVFGPASAILREARKGGYGTVVVGRRGRGGFKGLLLGSVSAKLISTLKDRTVWVVS